MLYTVLRWETKKWGDRPVQVADEILCRDCSHDHVTSKPRKQEISMQDEQEQEQQEEVQEELTPREIAIELGKVLSPETPHSSKWLAEAAGLEYSEAIVDVLKVLLKMGKVVRWDNGWWTKA
jgi:hypothetical protein